MHCHLTPANFQLEFPTLLPPFIVSVFAPHITTGTNDVHTVILELNGRPSGTSCCDGKKCTNSYREVSKGEILLGANSERRDM